MRTSPAIVLREGTRFGKYALRARIATGGTSEVWLAVGTSEAGLPREVVLKTLLPHLAADAILAQQFLMGSELGARLKHPNIVQVLDSGECELGCFFAMEYLKGRTLREILNLLAARSDALPVWAALQIACRVCDALEYAHGQVDPRLSPQGILHRDVSPENIMITTQGDVVLLDFGVSNVSSTSLASSVGLRGKYAYSAPEQLTELMDGTTVDPRSDVYSLGVVLYEMLTGNRPHPSNDDVTVLRAVLAEFPAVARPSVVAPRLPSCLDPVVLRALARLPAQRFQSAAELRAALDGIGLTRGDSVVPRHLASFVAVLLGGDDPLRPEEPTLTGLAIPALPPMVLDEEWETVPEIPVLTDCGSAALEYATPEPSRVCPSSRWPTGSSAGDLEPPPLRRQTHDWDAALARAKDERRNGSDRISVDESQKKSATYDSELSAEPQASVRRQAVIHMEQGLALARRGDTAEAIKELERSLLLNPAHRVCRANLNLLRKRRQEEP